MYISLTMILKIGLFQCILINLALVHSFGLINLKNIKEDEFVSKLEKMLGYKKEHKIKHKNHISVRSSRKDLHDAHNTFERKRLIKTILPHGKEVKIDTKDDVFYKALVRIHKKKPIFVKDNDEYKLQFDYIGRSKPDDKQINEENVKQNQNSTSDVSKIWQKLKDLKNEHKAIYDKKKNLRSVQDYLNTTRVGESFSNFWERIKSSWPWRRNEKKKRKKDRTSQHKLLRLFDDSGK